VKPCEQRAVAQRGRVELRAGASARNLENPVRLRLPGSSASALLLLRSFCFWSAKDLLASGLARESAGCLVLKLSHHLLSVHLHNERHH